MAPSNTSEFDRQLRELEAELKRLEVEYNLYFAGRLSKLPWETRARIEAAVKRFDRMQIQNTAERFRFQGLQSRFSAFCELWERNLKAREGMGPSRMRGRSAGAPPPSPPAPSPTERAPFGTPVLTVRDPAADAKKVRALYEQLREARRQAGEADVPFDRFQDVVRAQVSKFGRDGGEVVFKVGVKDGRVSFTAKPAAKKDEDL